MRLPNILMCALACALSLTSCDDFLEDKSRNTISDEEAYGTLSALKNNTVLDLYNYIGGTSNSEGLQGTDRGVFDLNSLTTDEAIVPTRGGDWYDGGLWQRLFTHSWTASEEPFYDTWNYLYKVVMLCNKYVEIVEDYQTKHPEDVATTTTYLAEIRAIRCIYYFYIIDLFGNAPLVLETGNLNSTVLQTARYSAFDYIVNELREVAPLLPATKSNNYGDYYGRVTRPVAYAYLAKMCLNAPVYADVDWTDGEQPDGKELLFSFDGQSLNAWEATIAYCDSVAAYGYALEKEFSDNFSTANEGSTENIFTIPLSPDLYPRNYNYFFRSRHYCHGAVLGGASENGPSTTIEMLDAMGYGGTEDPRFRRTFYADTVVVDGTTVKMDNGVTPLVYRPREVKLVLTGSDYMSTAGARLAKYANDPYSSADGRRCHNDIVLLRYADILLMKAEAQVRNGEDGSAALNEVRARVGLPAVTATLDNILQERFVELAWEGWRRNDLIRYGLFHKAYTDRPTLTNEASGYTTVFPIPYEVMTMHPTWKQNPGY